MEDQDKTFNVLKRIPYREMNEILNDPASVSKNPPIFNLGGVAFESRKNEIVRHYERMKVLEKHGWDFESFVLESEKRNIMEAIAVYNHENAFPLELVERAREFFPNAKFTEAKIELE
jgi:hypothetical protein